MSEKLTEEKYPKLFAECDPKVDLTLYKAGSHKKVEWTCSDCGYVWTTDIRVRAIKGCGCPKCNGNHRTKPNHPRFVPVSDSLAFFYPDVMEYWVFDANQDLDPYHISPKSEYVAHWKCPKEHKFERPIDAEVKSTAACPECSKGDHSSFGEQFIYEVCANAFGEQNVFNQNTSILGFEVDVLIPSYRIGFEYGSLFWHKNKTSEDALKIQQAKQQGYTLYCIYDGCNAISDVDSSQLAHAFCIPTKTVRENYQPLKEYIDSILSQFSVRFNEVHAANCAKNTMHQRTVPYEKSFAYRYPTSLEEWDYDRNGGITPDMVYASSQQKYYFICPEGHSYQATPDHKTRRGDGCPVCANKEIRANINSLAALHPDLLRIWDWDKNPEDPYQISSTYAEKKTWHWKCPECGCEWSTKSSATLFRNDREEYCPDCRQRKPLLEVIESVHISWTSSVFISQSLSPIPNVDRMFYDRSTFNEIEKFVRRQILVHQNLITGNNKNWVLTTETMHLVISKEKSGLGTFRQCYISDVPLAGKEPLDKKGMAKFSNIVPFGGNSFAEQRPDAMRYWDWDKNEKDPYKISNNIGALKVWHWKCPDCGYEWETTRPIKNGGNQAFFCRNCYLREKLREMITREENPLHFYDKYGQNGERDIAPNEQIMSLLRKVADENLGEIDTAKGSVLVVNVEGAEIRINSLTAVIRSVSGVDCPEAPAGICLTN